MYSKWILMFHESKSRIYWYIDLLIYFTVTPAVDLTVYYKYQSWELIYLKDYSLSLLTSTVRQKRPEIWMRLNGGSNFLGHRAPSSGERHQSHRLEILHSLQFTDVCGGYGRDGALCWVGAPGEVLALLTWGTGCLQLCAINCAKLNIILNYYTHLHHI